MTSIIPVLVIALVACSLATDPASDPTTRTGPMTIGISSIPSNGIQAPSIATYSTCYSLCAQIEAILIELDGCGEYMAIIEILVLFPECIWALCFSGLFPGNTIAEELHNLICQLEECCEESGCELCNDFINCINEYLCKEYYVCSSCVVT
ncbi:unnamed protein product [Allacma fusca]|uniref:Saposin B-type domain-containing protein n=1 Tax=Allacma fusca TaxID=39272 RepID=A0A8J2P972_9HEXA|nr:unnamed protein product [Allacma fusca]